MKVMPKKLPCRVNTHHRFYVVVNIRGVCGGGGGITFASLSLAWSTPPRPVWLHGFIQRHHAQFGVVAVINATGLTAARYIYLHTLQVLFAYMVLV